MTEHQQIDRKQKDQEKEQRQRVNAQEPTCDQLKAHDEGTIPGLDLSYSSSLDQHVKLLAELCSQNQRTDLLMQLQQAYGNRYVQRLIEPMAAVQAKLAVSTPGDIYEQEADQKAEKIMRKPDPEIKLQYPAEDEPLPTKATCNTVPTLDSNLEINIKNLQGSGQSLPESVRNYFEPHFRYDIRQVRIHTDARAADLACSINAHAFTVGRDIVFGAGRYAPATGVGRSLIAHELMHVVHQESVGKRVQRYEAGEHAQLGETQEELKKSFKPTEYVVRKGDSLSDIALKFGITIAELKDTNKDKLKKWPATDGSRRMIEGFNAGETVLIPQKLSEFAKAATEGKLAKVTVNGVVLDYGVAMAMGDLFDSPEQMAKASPKELKELAALIIREKKEHKLVSTDEWQKATGGRYLKLAMKNVAHFAPSSAAGAASGNHKSEWEKYHKVALNTSKSGDKDKALIINAYADHFLTDAFCAGHLVNKVEIMEKFKSQLKLKDKGKEFTKESAKFFDDVAKDAFTGSVKAEFSKYESIETHWGFHPNINSISRFSILLQEIHKKEPDLLADAVAKGVHDRLNIILSGLPVKNAKGDSWPLSGDWNLNAKTKPIVLKAVAQSQLNVIHAYKFAGELDIPKLFEKVWDYTPVLSTAGAKQMMDVVKEGTDINSADLKKAVVKLIKDNYKLIIDELVKRNELKKA